MSGFWAPETLRSAVGGAWLARPRDGATIDGLSTDSRTLRPGQVFVALRGEHHDGHEHVARAGQAGAPLAIVDAPERLARPWPEGLGLLRVDDTGRALLRLASAYREGLSGTCVIGVSGSNGKTTTKELVHAVLSGGGLRGSASPKSFNNAVGVPITVLGARAGERYLVCEVGTNAPGEVAMLGGVVRPEIAVVTSVGRAHLEGLGSLEGVAREEASLLRCVPAGGVCFVNADAPIPGDALEGLAAPVVTFGQSERADLRVREVRCGPEGVRFVLGGHGEFVVPLLGRHNAGNAAAAVAVGLRLGLSPEVIARGLAGARGAPMRLERSLVAGVEIVNDAYNANPESALAAVATLGDLRPGPGGRRVFVLGDMLELGPASGPLHAEVGRAIGRSSAELVVLVGPLAAEAEAPARAGGAEVVVLPGVREGGDRSSAALLRAGDVVVLKGSRGSRLERVAEALRDGAGASEGVAAGAAPLPARTA